jgi:nitrous oxide reductase accessory protein NosL
MKKVIPAVLVLTLVLVAVVRGADDAGPAHSDTDRCPVCGMYVAKYRDWHGTVVFDDSTRAVMDGPKDLFKYYLDIGKYNPSKSRERVTALRVKDYYSMAEIDATKAYYVIWGDVYGPMGHEPIPFEKESDAKQFLKEHHGKKILKFKDITSKVIWSLDNP